MTFFVKQDYNLDRSLSARKSCYLLSLKIRVKWDLSPSVNQEQIKSTLLSCKEILLNSFSLKYALLLQIPLIFICIDNWNHIFVYGYISRNMQNMLYSSNTSPVQFKVNISAYNFQCVN